MPTTVADIMASENLRGHADTLIPHSPGGGDGWESQAAAAAAAAASR